MPTTLTLVNVSGTPAFLLNGDVPARVENVFGATLMKGRWLFPAYRPVYETVLEDLQKVARSVSYDAKVQQLLANYASAPDPIDGLVFKTKPLAHQIEGLRLLLTYPRAGLFFDPGLGKSKIIVDLYRARPMCTLILCPRIVLHTWAREFVTHGDIHNTLIVEDDAKHKRDVIAEAKRNPPAALIVTYESAVRLASELMEVPFQQIVADESHRIKSIQSIRTKATIMLSEKAPYRRLLSGTPTLGSPFSLYAQFLFLGRCFAPEKWIDFKRKFGHFSPEELRSPNPQRVTGYRNLEILNARVNRICMRRTQSECLDLPERQVIDIPFDLSAEQKAYYNELVDEKADTNGQSVKQRLLGGELSNSDGPDVGFPFVYSPEPVALLNKLEQVTGGFINRTTDNPGLCNGCAHLEGCMQARIRPYTAYCPVAKKPNIVPLRFKKNARAIACRDLLEDLVEDPSHKIIVWVRYLVELDIVKDIAKDLGVEAVTVQGGMKTSELEAAMHRFNTDPDCRLYIGQVASGIGVTLNAANYTVYYTSPWSHEHYNQSRARNYRIGQKRCVTEIRLVANGTTDVVKLAALDQKIEIEEALTASDYKAECLRHTANPVPGASCTCDGTIMRIVAKLKTIE